MGFIWELVSVERHLNGAVVLNLDYSLESSAELREKKVSMSRLHCPEIPILIWDLIFLKIPTDSNVKPVLRTTRQEDRKLPYLSLFSENVTGGK